jgi:hypothetical protein
MVNSLLWGTTGNNGGDNYKEAEPEAERPGQDGWDTSIMVVCSDCIIGLVKTIGCIS